MRFLQSQRHLFYGAENVASLGRRKETAITADNAAFVKGSLAVTSGLAAIQLYGLGNEEECHRMADEAIGFCMDYLCGEWHKNRGERLNSGHASLDGLNWEHPFLLGTLWGLVTDRHDCVREIADTVAQQDATSGGKLWPEKAMLINLAKRCSGRNDWLDLPSSSSKKVRSHLLNVLICETHYGPGWDLMCDNYCKHYHGTDRKKQDLFYVFSLEGSILTHQLKATDLPWQTLREKLGVGFVELQPKG